MTNHEIDQTLCAANLDLRDIQQKIQEVRAAVAKAKAALTTQKPPQPTAPLSQEPRLTLGRVPAGGKGLYILYPVGFSAELYYWNGTGWHNDSKSDVETPIYGSIGPLLDYDKVAHAWHIAGRPA